jgi:N-acetyl-gamma-glutamylphosphate reductase
MQTDNTAAPTHTDTHSFLKHHIHTHTPDTRGQLLLLLQSRAHTAPAVVMMLNGIQATEKAHATNHVDSEKQKQVISIL